jgi:hypothetical protein
VVILGSAVLCVSVFLPWYRISGFTYTFLDVDTWKVLPIAELVVASGAAIAALIRIAGIKRIGLFLGGTAFALNAGGAFVAGRLANVHNPDPYYRIWAVISIGPAWGGWIALLVCVVLIVGAMSRWPARVHVRDIQVGAGQSYSSEIKTSAAGLNGIPLQPHALGDDF